MALEQGWIYQIKQVLTKQLEYNVLLYLAVYKKVPKKKTFQTIRGARDILPQDQDMWEWVVGVMENTAKSYGFSKIETPILEYADLFKRSVGQNTDIVKKEMFSFKDQGGDNVALRPEMTASIMRAYIEHGLMNKPKPVKLYQIGPCYRYERPQAGRLRQFHQFNPEVIGSDDPVVDAEIIALSYAVLNDLGLDVVLQVNSIGTLESRRKFIRRLKNFYQNKLRYVCQDCKERYKNNPLRILDCKKKKCGEYIMEAPQIVDYLDEESKEHLMKMLEYLDDFDLPYNLNPQIVRGLDYYTKTVFEIWVKDNGNFSHTSSVLGGGGRYNKLIYDLGGKDTPAVGFALGLERVIGKLRDRNIKPPKSRDFDIFLAQLGDSAKKEVFKLFEDLRKEGYKVTFNLAKNSLKQQLDSANKLGVRITIIIGEREVINKEVLIKEMESGVQDSVPVSKLEKELEKILK